MARAVLSLAVVCSLVAAAIRSASSATFSDDPNIKLRASAAPVLAATPVPT